MWLKRCCAMAAIVLLLFSVSLQPCYAEATDTGSPLYLYIDYPTCPSPLLNSVAYPVPWNKFEIGHNFPNFDPSPSSYSDTALGVESSIFKALTTSGAKPTIYYFVEYLVTGLVQLIAMIPSAFAMLTYSIGYLPSVLLAFAAVAITLSIVFLILGR